MRKYAKKPESPSRTLDSNPKASRQAPISEILQSYQNRISEKQAIDGSRPGHEAKRREKNASKKRCVIQGQFQNTSSGLVIQRKDANVRITGITHLVEKQEDQEDSIMEGNEYREVSDPTELKIDDEMVLASRRGPNQELFEHIDRLQKDMIYKWFNVKSIDGEELEEGRIYVREGTFQLPKIGDSELIRHEKARKRGENRVEVFIQEDDMWYEGRISGYKKEAEKWMVVVWKDGKTDKFKVRESERDIQVEGTVNRRGEEVRVVELFDKEKILYEIYDVTYQGEPQPDKKEKWIEAKYISPLTYIPPKAEAEMIHYYSPSFEPHGAEYVQPSGLIDLTSHAIGSGIYGLHPATKKPEDLEAKTTITIHNPFIIQNRNHGECFKDFSKKLAELTEKINAQVTISQSTDLKKGLDEILETEEYKKEINRLFKKLRWLLTRAGHPSPPISVINQAIRNFLLLYRGKDPYVEQVSTILFSHLGFGGISGNDQTGFSSMSTGNIKFLPHEERDHRRGVRNGTKQIFTPPFSAE